MEDLSIIISLILSLITFYLGRMQGAKNEGETQGVLLNELKNIKRDLEELKTDFKNINPEKINTEISYLKDQLVNYEQNLYLATQRNNK